MRRRRRRSLQIEAIQIQGIDAPARAGERGVLCVASRWTRATQGRGSGRTQPRMAPSQVAAVDAALRCGPNASCFTTDLWTLSDIAVVIERVTGIRYPGQSGVLRFATSRRCDEQLVG